MRTQVLFQLSPSLLIGALILPLHHQPVQAPEGGGSGVVVRTVLVFRTTARNIQGRVGGGGRCDLKLLTQQCHLFPPILLPAVPTFPICSPWPPVSRRSAAFSQCGRGFTRCGSPPRQTPGVWGGTRGVRAGRLRSAVFYCCFPQSKQ